MKKWKKIVVLYILVIMSFNTISVKADTVDDLRDILEIIRSDDAELDDKVNNILITYGTVSNNDRLKEILEDLNLDEKINNTLDNLEKELNTIKSEFADKFSSDEDVNSIISMITKVEKKQSEFSLMKKNIRYIISYAIPEETEGVSVDDIEQTENKELEESYEYVKSILNTEDGITEIGEVSKNMRAPIGDKVVRLKQPFGEIVDNYNSKTKLNKGVYLVANAIENEKVVSQWDGKVVDIVQNKDNTYKIIIQHSDNLQTIYDKLNKTKLNKEDIIKQYETIGSINKGKTLYFEITLDNLKIDPIILYGDRGSIQEDLWSLSNTSKSINKDTLYSGIKSSNDNYNKGIKIYNSYSDGEKIEFYDGHKKPNTGVIE